jgi:uncharacterized membrane protein YgaE (UPF0421/DUF939 family)
LTFVQRHLRRRLVYMTALMNPCFTEGDVLRLLDGRLTPVELQLAEQHLDEIEVAHGLPTARKTLAEIARQAAQRHTRLLARKAAELSHKLRAAE